MAVELERSGQIELNFVGDTTGLGYRLYVGLSKKV